MKPALQLATGVLVALLAAAAGVWVSQRSSEPSSVKSGAAEKLMALELPDRAGKPRRMLDWRGKVLVVNFWATWCPPCIEEMPGFERLSRKYAQKGVEFVGISIDTAGNVNEFASLHEITYPLLVGNGETLKLAKDFGNAMQGLPFTVILDREGKARRVKLGRFNEADLESALMPLI